MISSNKYKYYFALIVLLFILLRVSGLGLPYHQDELKTQDLNLADGDTPHPPLTEIIFSLTAKTFGDQGSRGAPFIFGLANLFLLYFLVSYKFGKKAGLWSAAFFALAFYSVLASLMIDTDGQILPFFFLLSLISYFKWQEAAARSSKIIWGAVLIFAVILGFLTKLSFIIVAGAIILDFLIEKSKQLNRRALLKYCLMASGLPVLMIISLLGAKVLFPSYDVARTIGHATDFLRISGRAYIQVLIESVKAVLYASPLLIVPLFFIKKRHITKFRLLFIFLILGLIFYLVLFDFSRAALDKYLAFIIVPLAIISGVIVSEGISEEAGPVLQYRKLAVIILGLIVVLIVFFLQFIPHLVPALYPKEEWISRITHFKWNFVFLFTGGSGPIGFYVSWLFISFNWILAVLLAMAGIIKRNLQKTFLILILTIGLVYNTVFIEEYLFGKINGSVIVLLNNAAEFIKKNDNIKSAMSYMGIGTFELEKMGKYERRIYAIPKNEGVYRKILNDFRSYILVIDIPHLNPLSMYAKYFASCKVIYDDNSKYISAKIYDCKNAISL